jgi:hypothetical protein
MRKSGDTEGAVRDKAAGSNEFAGVARNRVFPAASHFAGDLLR